MSKEVIGVDFKNRNATIQCSEKILRLVREHFSVKNPVFVKRKFDPRRYAITPSGAFQIGIWEEISGFIRSLPIEYEIKYSDAFKKALLPQIKIDKIEKIDNFQYHDYQEETIRRFLTYGRGIALLATSAGKTLVAAGFCKTLLKHNPKAKILIVVPNIGLLNQTHYSFINEYSLDENLMTTWGDKKLPDLKRNILFANTQILLSDVKKSIRILKDFDYVIIDEVHCLGDRTNKINKVIHNIETNNKFGLSGTLPDEKFSCWNILGKVGPILIEESSYNVRQKGTAAQIKVAVIYCHHGKIPTLIPIPHDFQPTWKYENECRFIYTHKERNDLIIGLADKAKGNSLIIVDKRLHGDELYKYKTNKEIYYIHGDMPVEQRVEITNKIERQDNIICIAMAQIFAVGISIKNLKNLVFCAIGKSNVRVCQSIGRAMRLHENKDFAAIFDIADNSEYSKEHLLKRLAIYKEEKIDFRIKTKKLCK